MEKVVIEEFLFKVKDWSGLLLKKWKTIFVFCLLGAVLGVVYSLYKKPIYKASTTFVLEEDNSNNLIAQYAGIASMVGLDFGSSGNSIFQGDNIMELYRSQNMIQKTLLSEYSLNGSSATLIDKYLDLKNLKKNWKNNPKLNDINFSKYRFGSDRTKDSILQNVISVIKKKYLSITKLDKKLSIIKVEVSFENENFAEAFDNALVKNVSDFYVQTKTKKATTNLRILQNQTDSIRTALNNAISNVATSMDANPNLNPARQILRVPSQKRQIDAEANKAILTELVKNLELAKISLRRETPLIQVIDTPVQPLDRDYVGLVKAAVYGFALFFLIGVIVIIIKNDIKVTLARRALPIQ